MQSFKALTPYFSLAQRFCMSVMLFVSIAFAQFAYAGIDVYEFKSPAQEAQYRALIEEFRCPKCQNQNLASSDAMIAQDLKQKTYELVAEGKSDTEIRNYMIDRYGEFITYKPPINQNTAILWVFPPVLLFFALLFWFIKTRKNAKQKTASASGLSAEEAQKLKQILADANQQKENKT